MAIDWDDVVAIAPSLSDVPTDAQTLILATVAKQVGPVQWGNLQDEGQLYLAAHLGALVLAPSSANAGPVVSETVGAVSRTFGSTAMTSTGLSSTPWGREYDRIRSLLPCRFGLLA